MQRIHAALEFRSNIVSSDVLKYSFCGQLWGSLEQRKCVMFFSESHCFSLDMNWHLKLISHIGGLWPSPFDLHLEIYLFCPTMG